MWFWMGLGVGLALVVVAALWLFEVGKLAFHAHRFIRTQGRVDIGYSTVFRRTVSVYLSEYMRSILRTRP